MAQKKGSKANQIAKSKQEKQRQHHLLDLR
jgi:hypothetical protein